MKSRIEELLDEVKNEARGDMNRVRRVVDHLLPRPTLETELLEEMAGALGRVEKKLRTELERLHAIGEHDLVAWRAQHAKCLRAFRDLVIQRESLRFPHDPRLAERYGLPKRR
jgi:hypothetical protein